MDARVEFQLGETIYRMTAPTALQLFTAYRIVHAHCLAERTRKALLEKLGFRSIENIVDVGACIGTLSLSFNAVWPDAKILAIEPHPVSFSHLAHNCKDIPNITPYLGAASDKNETIQLSLPDFSQRPDIPTSHYAAFNVGMASRYGGGADYAATAAARPLDDIVDFRPDLIKIDVEGAEKTVLLGARRLLLECRPLVCIELREENLAMGGTSISEVTEILDGFGYRLVAKLFEDPVFQCR